MATISQVVSHDAISPAEFIEWVSKNVDAADDASMIAASERLAALKNNRDFIAEKIISDMRLIASGGAPEYSSTQGTIHARSANRSGDFIVRSVIWTPPLTNNKRSQELQDRVLSFVTPHDHNFALLTIGYFGPGYTTDIYEYDVSSVTSENGQVEIKYLTSTTLNEGKIIYFSPTKDVHVQLHPTSVSISLNLIADAVGSGATAQYEFDLERKRTTNLLRGNSVRQMLLPFYLADLVGLDSRLTNLVEQIALVHKSEHIRKRAYISLYNQTRDAHSLKKALEDSSAIVRSGAKEILENLT